LRYISSQFCFGCFGDGGLTNSLPGLALNKDPPDLSLSGSKPHTALHSFESWLLVNKLEKI
jgi:hypothetical protein